MLKDCLDDLKLTIDSMEPLDADLLALLATLRFRLFSTGGILSDTNGMTTIRLAVRDPEERAWWRRLLEKMISLVPNCNSVAQTSG